MLRFLLGFAISVSFITLSLTDAKACVAGPFRHAYPSCTILTPPSEMQVALVRSRSKLPLSSHYPATAGQETRIVTLELVRGSPELFIVLEAQTQTIWKFEGMTNKAWRVIVLGAENIGPHGAGVIGIPPERVTFAEPDLSLRDYSQQSFIDAFVDTGKPFLPMSCVIMYKTCNGSQWFGPTPGELTDFYPEPGQTRITNDVIVIDGNSNLSSPDFPLKIVAPPEREQYVEIDPAKVVSLEPVKPYDKALDRGASRQMQGPSDPDIVTREGDMFEPAVISYAEAFSARFRTRFDPDFIYAPPISYVIDKPAWIYHYLDPSAYLIKNNAPWPELRGRFQGCFYYQEFAGGPVTGTQKQRYYSCRRRTDLFTGEDAEIIRTVALYDEVEGQLHCQMQTLPADTHIAVVALSEGRHRRSDSGAYRQIDIKIARPGPVLLYLSMEGGPVFWNVQGQNVVDIYMSVAPRFSPQNIHLNGEKITHKKLASTRNDCPRDPPRHPNRLGPQIALLDIMMERLFGQRIDQLAIHTDHWKPWLKQDAPVPLYVIK